MQDDLISRSDLLKEFDPNGELLDPMAVRMKIVTAPTAYDVEKVVAELEKMRDRKSKNIQLNSQSYDMEYKLKSNDNFFAKVIEVIRNGGKE